MYDRTGYDPEKCSPEKCRYFGPACEVRALFAPVPRRGAMGPVQSPAPCQAWASTVSGSQGAKRV